MALYGLFKKERTCDRVTGKVDGRPRYTQIGTDSYRKAIAIRVFQNRLIAGIGELRPIRVKAGKASKVPATHVLCEPCAAHTHGGCKRGDCACGCGIFVWGGR